MWSMPVVSSPAGEIIVKFTGEAGTEPSADLGGPRREYFTYVLQDVVRKSGMFTVGRYTILFCDKLDTWVRMNSTRLSRKGDKPKFVIVTNVDNVVAVSVIFRIFTMNTIVSITKVYSLNNSLAWIEFLCNSFLSRIWAFNFRGCSMGFWVWWFVSWGA